MWKGELNSQFNESRIKSSDILITNEGAIKNLNLLK